MGSAALLWRRFEGRKLLSGLGSYVELYWRRTLVLLQHQGTFTEASEI